MPTFEKYPSTPQFSAVCKHARDNASYHRTAVAKAKMRGTVKIHGTNAAVCTADGEVWLQTRERVVPADETHFGFRESYIRNAETYARIFDKVRAVGGLTADHPIQLYGEWCGAGIQKGVGVSRAHKFFALFGVTTGTGEARLQWTSEEISNYLAGLLPHPQPGVKQEVFEISQFGYWEIDIDFEKPTLVQNQLVDITNQVEARCPVAVAVLPREITEAQDTVLIGEGVVWNFFETHMGHCRFKVKGEKHSTSKVKTTAAIDPELVKSIDEFLGYAASANRLEQGIMKLREMGLDPEDRTNIGAYVKWVVGDVVAEEIDTIVSSGLEIAQVSGPLARTASQYIINFQKDPK